MITEMKKGGVLEQINGVQPHQYVEPPKHEGTVEVTGYYMNDFEKKTYTVMTRIREQIKGMEELISKKETSANEKSRLNLELNTLRQKFSYVKDLMYLSINDRLDFWDKSLGVSKGFKIVIPEIQEATVVEIPIELPSHLAEQLKDFIEKALKDKTECTTTKSPRFNSAGNNTLH